MKEYDVTFSVGGIDTVIRLPYGAIPEYPSLPEKPEDSLYYYVFEGWDKQIAPVVGDDCYTAVFSREYILPTASGGGSLTLEGTVYVADFATANYSSYGIVGALERAAAKNVALRVNVNTVSVYFTVSAVKAAMEAGATDISVSFSKYASDRYTYAAHLLDGDGDPVASNVRMELSFYQPGTVENDRMKLSYTVDGERHYARYSIADDRLTFSAVPGREYTLQVEYRANLIFVGMAEASLTGDVFIEGANVGISVSVPTGVRLVSVYYLDPDGKQVAITGDSFRMPAFDVSVYVQTEVIKYRITFVCDGVIMKTEYCTYGELPTPPEDPKKSSNGEFNYTFVGWSDEIQPATDIKVYMAVFDAEPVPETPDAAPVGDSIYDKAMKGVLIAAAAVVVCIFGAIVAVIKR